MRKKIIFMVLAILCLANVSKAETVTVDDFTITQGETYTVALQLTNTTRNLTAFQMTLTLPSGLTLVSAEPTGRYSGQVVIGQPANNEYNICGADLLLGTISGTSGDLLILTFEASNTFRGGTATISDIDFVTVDRQHKTAPDTSFKVDYEKGAVGLVGDANEDEDVNVIDVMAIVNYIIGNPTDVFNEINADVNEDGEVNIIDAMAIINMIL